MSPLEKKQSVDSLADQASAGRYWRSIDALSRTPEFLARMREEFPEARERDLAGLGRREFTKLMAASLALAGATLSGCRRWPDQEIRPQSSTTEGFLPGVAEYFATQFELGGIATGILAKSMDGRPIKVEGNGQHPFSLGAASVFAQASILELYDPDRTRGYRYRKTASSSAKDANIRGANNETLYSRADFEAAMTSHFAVLAKTNGRGLHVLAQPNCGPTFAGLRQQFQSAFPEARWHVYQSLDRDEELSGSNMAFGRPLRCQYHLQNASTIVCLDADLLGTHPGHLKWSRDWAATRNPDSGKYSRLWMYEAGYSITGAAADVRQVVLPSAMIQLVRTIAAGLGVNAGHPELAPAMQHRVDQLVGELKGSGAHSLVTAGPSQPSEVHAWVHAINQHLGSIGTTVSWTEEPLAENKSSAESFAELAGALRGGSVDTLLILDGNPLYDGPADLKLELQGTQGRSITSIHVGLFENETAQQCTWHAPLAHFLESWGDGRAWDGTYGVQQPLIHPLFEGISAIEMLSLAIGKPIANGLELVRATAREQFEVTENDAWQQLLHDGVLADSQFATVNVPTATLPAVTNFANADNSAGGFEICFAGGYSTQDGRFANNGWLQELPDPLTKMTWGNAALISKQDADACKLDSGDGILIRLSDDFQLSDIPVLIHPGQMPGTISLALGYGRTAGYIAQNVGTNVGAIRTVANRYAACGASISRTGKRHELACTQEHFLMDAVGAAGMKFRVGDPGGPGALVRETSLQKHRQNPSEVHSRFHSPKPAPMFDPPAPFNSPCKWGMSIDLNKCVGCNGCVIACQSENNVPIVGKANVLRNREMHWLRIDRYFKGEIDSPDVVHVPMACAHCESAPCEQVCPVAATVHDTEGLNAMVYNRCVGTRYCANNCPYKVRRFNYFDFHASNPRAPAKPWLGVPDQQPGREIKELVQMGFNPDVSVRMRGVMEKCTYCVQRISNARIQARNEYANGDRSSPIPLDGEVVTACQQACPTGAIQFGDLNDSESKISQSHQDARAYAMLEELNIRPRTKYLTRVRNISGETAAIHGSAGDHEHT